MIAEYSRQNVAGKWGVGGVLRLFLEYNGDNGPDGLSILDGELPVEAVRG